MTGAAVLARDWARRGLVSRAADATDWVSGRTALIVAPHPDDETLGCGARILHATARGVHVAMLVATDGESSHRSAGEDPDALGTRRRREFALAAERLGVNSNDLLALGMPDGRLSDHEDVLAARIRVAAKEAGAQDVYVTCEQERHPDHAAAARAARHAVRGLPNVRLLEYPIWLWADWPLSRRQSDGRALARWARYFAKRSVECVDVTSIREAKATALNAYASQLAADGAPGRALPAAVVHRALDGPELFFVVRPPA